MRANRSPLILAALWAVAALAQAEEAAYPTVGDLSRVQSETMMFEAKAKRAEAHARMTAGEMKAGIDTSNTPNQPSVTASELPTVTGISGAAGRLYATFRYPNGNTATAKSGESIPGGFKVAEVSLDRAVITRGDRRIPLQYGSAPTETAQPNMGQMLPGQLPGVYPAPSPIQP